MNHPSRASVGVERPLPELLITREERDRLVALPDCDVRTCPPFFHSVDVGGGHLLMLSYCSQDKTGGCPASNGCCAHCNENRKEFVAKGGYDFFTDEERSFLQSVWSQENGFIGQAGCNLPRKLRPNECLEWNCKDYIYTVTAEWNGADWEIDAQKQLKRK